MSDNVLTPGRRRKSFLDEQHTSLSTFVDVSTTCRGERWTVEHFWFIITGWWRTQFLESGRPGVTPGGHLSI